MIKVETVYGEPELEKKLQDLETKGIRPDNVLSDGGKYYTVVYEDKSILNEG